MGKSEKIKPADLQKITTYPISKRQTKTNIKAFGQPIDPKKKTDFFESLPKFLKAEDLKNYIEAVHKARIKNKPFHLLLGAHTIKVGLTPIFIDLIKHKIVTGFSFNCAGLIHDIELAFFGGTSEDVQKGLADGSFGMVEETAAMFAEVVDFAASEDIGLGEAGGIYINANKAKYADLSIFAAANKHQIPATIHVGIGTDTIAQHPNYDAAKIGAASHLDFRILATICKEINNGGVLANIGSAVLLPEVFLKALTVARNTTKNKNKLTTANFDMITHYRPTENVLNRPTHNAGAGYNFVGHHEIMIPLLAWGLKQSFTN
ncbi:MAG: hypothetical protein DWP97_12765 [Calditrichaeota bacterium]|nr:MAG: hypothetical protein DWP97_12765 [Calditrichota bacterium]